MRGVKPMAELVLGGKRAASHQLRRSLRPATGSLVHMGAVCQGQVSAVDDIFKGALVAVEVVVVECAWPSARLALPDRHLLDAVDSPAEKGLGLLQDGVGAGKFL